MYKLYGDYENDTVTFDDLVYKALGYLTERLIPEQEVEVDQDEDEDSIHDLHELEEGKNKLISDDTPRAEKEDIAMNDVLESASIWVKKLSN